MNKNFKPKNLLGQIKEKEAEDFFKNYYQDRGMLKWQGFFLSDHTAALSKKERLKKIFLSATTNFDFNYGVVNA